MDDAESGGLFGDDADVTWTGHCVGHARIEPAGGKEADVCSGGAGRGSSERNRIARERAGIVGDGEDSESGDVEIDVAVRIGNAGGSGLDYYNVLGHGGL